MRKTEKKSGKRIYISLIVLIPIVVYLLSFSSLIYNTHDIEKHMEKSGLVMHAKTINSFVVHYMMDPGETRLLQLEVFSEKEKQHLLDVKILVHRTFDFLFLLLVLFFVLVYYNRKINKSKNWSRLLIYAGMIAVAIPIVLYFIPFEPLFTAFHNIFFAKCSWVFAPGSAIIQIYPFDFWHSISFSLFLRGFVTGWLLIFAGFIVGKK
jgi:integral membrane protein (TIGR01906 family)